VNIVFAKQNHTGVHPRNGEGQSIAQYLVLRYGKENFETDGSFDNTNETMLHKHYFFYPTIRKQDWYYNSETDAVQEVAP